MYDSPIQLAKDKFKSSYGSLLLLVLPQILLIAFNFYVIDRYLSVGIGYVLYTYISSTVVGFIVLSVTVNYIKYDDPQFDMVFNPFRVFIQYVIFSLVYSALVYVFGLLVQANGDLNFILKIVEPFARFIMGANSQFGATFRIIISLDIILTFYIGIIGLIFYRFSMIPYNIIDDYNVLEALQNSMEQTSLEKGIVFHTLFHSYLWILIPTNIYMLFALNANSTGTIQFYSYAFLGFVILVILPLLNITFAYLYDKIK